MAVDGQVSGFVVYLMVGVVALVVLFVWVVPVGTWITAKAAGVRVPVSALVGMRIRRVDPAKIIGPMIEATKADVRLSVSDLEAHYLAGGNVENVVKGLIAARAMGISLDFKAAAALDLAKRDVVQEISEGKAN